MKVSARVYLRTAHNTFVVIDRSDGRLKHLDRDRAFWQLPVDLRDIVSQGFLTAHSVAYRPITSGPLGGYTMLRSRSGGGVNFVRAGYFLCAEAEWETLFCNRLTAAEWELFTLVSEQGDCVVPAS